MGQAKARDELLDEIVSIELRMFLAVQTSNPTACQEQPETFRLMRRASHSVLSAETLQSYLTDLEESIDEDTNLMTLKYARIDDLVPCLNENPVIDRIVEVEEKWLRELEEKYPLTFVGRSEFATGVYLRSELETYSDRTLESYFKDISKALKEGRNLTSERYTFLFQQIGYNSIEEMEAARQQGT